MDCERETLAASCVGFVERCTCGSLHLGIGPVTIRVEPVTFLRFARLVAEAQGRLRREPLSPDVAAQLVRMPTDAS